jgi:hypothetical protein
MTSKAAKAAAVLLHVAMEPSYEKAVRLFDALANSSGPIDDMLDGFEVSRWEAFTEWDDANFWENIETTAIMIDQAKKHFGMNE